MKFKKGDKVKHFDAVGTISEVKMGGYLVDFEKSKGNFVYESELIVAELDELDKLHRAYEALLHTPEAEGYQAWTLAQKLLDLALRQREELNRRDNAE